MADQTTISPEALRDFYAEHGETVLALKEANVRIRRLTSELEAARAALDAAREAADGRPGPLVADAGRSVAEIIP